MKGITNPLHREKVFRITIYSKDRIAGDVRDGVYAIDLPDFIQDINKYHIGVEECILASEPTSAGAQGISRTYVVETGIVAPDSHSTSSKSNTRVLFCMCKPTSASNSIGYYYKPITTSTYSIPLVDLSSFRTKQMRINFRRIDDNPHDGISMPDASTWVMTLVVYPLIA